MKRLKTYIFVAKSIYSSASMYEHNVNGTESLLMEFGFSYILGYSQEKIYENKFVITIAYDIEQYYAYHYFLDE